MSDQPTGGGISAIFVHVGAGYHSPGNEKVHLRVCENACKAAMGILKNGGSALNAVEMAILVMEDSELTNAGYGSNLTIDGNVECDATIVDHLGRSGAAGAVAQVKNPISLARVILEASSRPLTCHRVPPNFLVGDGATDFAFEQGLVVLPPDALISRESKERWHRWLDDLRSAELKGKSQEQARLNFREFRSPFVRRPMVSRHSGIPINSPTPRLHDNGALSASGDLMAPPTESVAGRQGTSAPNNLKRQHHEANPDGDTYGDGAPCTEKRIITPRDHDLRFSGTSSEVADEHPRTGSATLNTGSAPGAFATEPATQIPETTPAARDEDLITDTVGAIAVDSNGNIAAGSSSGGIGAKHRGRVGPAALVGIGTYVIPTDPNDPEQTSVASVTSGTGEHITTTMAAQTSALRVYYSQRRRRDGEFEKVSEDEAMKAMIDTEFMGHPGVKASPCGGAIGILAVKRTIDGIFFYFGHNSDSFALASMSSEDEKPLSVMSRNRGNETIAQGGRACVAKK
ncbi:threonine aspartase 1 [Aspergillus clavatus NRRL 1]|uniref:Asparaginase family protein n=1 Tax=Aspergillus clavatus (strain ATCC 1007 / CBS 513.65 / DSM 816 / NCTC 3887 / NRRL 1 / QM 1276 / 107) TaxID=344612 RepID=A1CBA9_ASPCL|nr:asparaginase family protein [Aspergillus clavatus NRRL 1]EAW13027.1 asparaginase family protein [Aspergillus clavatus NRRL 1]